MLVAFFRSCFAPKHFTRNNKLYSLAFTFIAQVQVKIFSKAVLTDIVVALALSEFFPQSERSEALELLRKLLRCVRGKRVAALPAHLVVGLGTAGVVVFALNHVEHVALGVLRRYLAQRVVWAHDVKVVVQSHLDRVVVPSEPDKTRGKSFCYVFYFFAPPTLKCPKSCFI